MKKASSVKKKSVVTEYFCPHCGESGTYPVAFCKVCNQHHHTVFMGLCDKPAHPGICRGCALGRSKVGRAWRRSQGTWAPESTFESSWDDPEWYDMLEAWKSETQMEVWSYDGIADENI